MVHLTNYAINKANPNFEVRILGYFACFCMCCAYFFVFLCFLFVCFLCFCVSCLVSMLFVFFLAGVFSW